jgi:hypothetical protein
VLDNVACAEKAEELRVVDEHPNYRPVLWKMNLIGGFQVL